jgi:hypothetical protein
MAAECMLFFPKNHGSPWAASDRLLYGSITALVHDAMRQGRHDANALNV